MFSWVRASKRYALLVMNKNNLCVQSNLTGTTLSSFQNKLLLNNLSWIILRNILRKSWFSHKWFARRKRCGIHRTNYLLRIICPQRKLSGSDDPKSIEVSRGEGGCLTINFNGFWIGPSCYYCSFSAHPMLCWLSQTRPCWLRTVLRTSKSTNVVSSTSELLPTLPHSS